MSTEHTELSVVLNYQAQSSLYTRADGDADDYIIPVETEIWGHADEPKDQPQNRALRLGNLNFYLIRVSNARNDRADLHTIFDSRQETSDVFDALYSTSCPEFRPAVQRQFEDAYPGHDVLLLHHLTIRPFARGQRLGLAVLERVIRDWSSGCSLVAMKPFPLQFAMGAKQDEKTWRECDYGSFSQTEAEAILRLRTYYARLGFERIGRSVFYGLCPEYERPGVKELDLPDTVRVPLSALRTESEAG